MINFFLIVMTLYLGFLIARYSSISKHIVAKNKRAFWDKESEANAVRRADISTLDYIKIPIDTLPLKEAEEKGCKSQVDIIIHLKDKQILNLSSYSNTDLKLMYGPANLDILSQCDENFTTLIKALNKIGMELLKADSASSAIAFFEYAVSIGSDISSTYVSLGTIYHTNGDTSKLDELIEKAKGLTSLSSSTTVDKLNNIKTS